MADKFDLTVHRRNAKGAIVDVRPYRLHIVDGKSRYERPPGSGWFYSAGGELLASPKQEEVKELPASVKAELKAGKPEAKQDVRVGSTKESVDSVLIKAQS